MGTPRKSTTLRGLLWLWMGVKAIMDAIGYSTIFDDLQHALSLLQKGAEWLFQTPWWVPGLIALVLTAWAVWSDRKRTLAHVAPIQRAPAPLSVAPSEEWMYIPRKDVAGARVVDDEGELFQRAVEQQRVIIQTKMKLTTATAGYVRAMVDILESIVGKRNLSNAEMLTVRDQLRELLVLLKGNDVWTYAETHYKRLPERWDIPETPDPYDAERQLIVAFGPPGEYGEFTIEVEVDNGQPCKISTDPRKSAP